MTQLMRNRIVFILVAVGAFVLAFGLGQVAGHKKDATPKDSSKPAPTYSVKLLDGDVLKDKQPLRFEVLDPKGKVVTEFDTVHEKKLHLIVVEKGDPRVYEHVHTTMASDGTWSATLQMRPGVYRVYADTTPTGASPQVLTADVTESGVVAGTGAFFNANDTTTVDGYNVALKADGTTYTFTVTKDGKPVTLQPYLGAGGHLVGIRTESLDYLHAHAMDAKGNTVGFHVAPGNSGLWVLHLDFRVDGKVHDATFVRRIEVDGPGSGMGEHMDMGDMEGHDHH